MRRQGYTFIELLVVVMLIGVVALAGLPALMHALAETRLKTAADDVEAAMALARAQAIGQGRATRIIFDVVANEYRLEELRATASLPNQATLPAASIETTSYAPMPHPLNRTEAFRVNLSGANTGSSREGVRLMGVNFAGGLQLAFDASGAPSTTGWVDVGDTRRTVRLSVNSDGRVTRTAP